MFKEIFKAIWEWFIKKVWPFILEMITSILISFAKMLFDDFMGHFTNHEKRQQEYANNKAEDESRKAKESKTPEAAANHERIAELWREVADNFRVENERLKSEFKKALDESLAKAKQNVTNLKVEDVLDVENEDNIRLKNINILPQLAATKDTDSKSH